MKVTIKQLEAKIQSLEKDKEIWYGKYQELKDANEKRKVLESNLFNQKQDITERQIRDLMEIIRWQINPQTAKAPFMPTKDERDGNTRNY